MDNTAHDNDNDELLRSQQQLQWPEDRKSDGSMDSFRLVCSNWTYSYMRQVLRKGAQQHKNETQGNTNTTNNQKLEQTDLFRAPSDMEADHVRKLFCKYYNSDKYTNTNGNKHDKHRFIKTLWHLASPTFIPAGVCQLVALGAQISIPLLVMQLLRILEEFPMENVVLEALPYTMGIFVAVVLNAFMNHRHHHLAYRSGVVMRVAVMSAIYDQSMRLSAKGRESITSGQVVNLVAIDTQKVSVVT
jgi:ATP-binding cassette subfamily C (CFTR/MRP) protein 1